MIRFQWKNFAELSLTELYAILKLRAEVFILEQHCPYLDPDGKDHLAFHLLGKEDHHLVAYLRVFAPAIIENNVIFGRIVTAKETRKKGYGKQLMQQMLDYCHLNFPNVPIACSAQFYLKNFYESFGFQQKSEVYLEDDIPHIRMELVR